MPLQKTENIWHNGKLIPWDKATIHVMSHVVHYGSSVFEGVRCYAPPGGPAIFRAQEHMQRLLDSAKVYRMDVDYTADELVAAMVEVVKANGVWPCYIRPIMFRGYGELGVSPLNSRSRFTSPTIPGASIWAGMAARAWMFAFPRGRALPRTRCPRWPRPARIT